MVEATSAQEGIATRPRLICAGWLKRAAARWWRKRQRTAVKSRDEGIPVAARLQKPQGRLPQRRAMLRTMATHVRPSVQRVVGTVPARAGRVGVVSGWCRGGVGGVAVGTGRRFGGLVHSWQWACFCDHSTALYCTIPVDALLWWQNLASMRLLKQAGWRCVAFGAVGVWTNIEGAHDLIYA